jgi:hypothetical protein
MHLLPQDDTFFKLFQQQITLVCEASELLAADLNSGCTERVRIAGQMKALEERGDALVRQIVERLQTTFLTPFEPEDVQALARALDNVLDVMEDAAFQMVACRIERTPPELVEFSQIVTSSCICLRQALENVMHRKPVGKDCQSVGRLENEADLLERRLLTDLFRSALDPVSLLKQKELFEILEAITDRCDDVANVLECVAMKAA